MAEEKKKLEEVKEVKEKPKKSAQELVSEWMKAREDVAAETDAEEIAGLLKDDGTIIVDETLPEEYVEDVAAQQVVALLTSVKQLERAVGVARHTGKHADADRLSKDLQYNRLLAARIQLKYPNIKPRVQIIARAILRRQENDRQAILRRGEQDEV